MKYEERLPPEFINTSKEHPLKELLVLLGASLLILAAVLLVIHQSSSWLARQIPLETEQRLFAGFPQDQAPGALHDYLNARLQALLPYYDIPEGMQVTLSVTADDTINAFATPGNHIILMKGLLQKLKHENALSMLLGHELAHVAHRDPLVSIARGATISLLLALISSDGRLSALNGVTELALLGFSREMEDSADAAALRALGGVYGHTGGAKELFEILQDAGGSGIAQKIPAFLSTHPALDERINLLAGRSRKAGYASKGKLTPLPAAFQSWLNELAKPND